MKQMIDKGAITLNQQMYGAGDNIHGSNNQQIFLIN